MHNFYPCSGNSLHTDGGKILHIFVLNILWVTQPVDIINKSQLLNTSFSRHNPCFDINTKG